MCAESKSAILKCYLSPLSLSLFSSPPGGKGTLLYYLQAHSMGSVYVYVCVCKDRQWL